MVFYKIQDGSDGEVVEDGDLFKTNLVCFEGLVGVPVSKNMLGLGRRQKF